MNKACSKCRVVKDLSGFNKDKHKAGGVTSQCKDCRRENTSAWRNSAAGRARFNAKQRQAYAENKTAGRVRRYKICDAKPWLRTFHSSVSNARRKDCCLILTRYRALSAVTASVKFTTTTTHTFPAMN